MSGFLLVQVKQVEKATVTTWNPLKTRNSLSGEFWVLSYDFCPIHIFHDTWRHAWKTGWKVCVTAYEAYQVLRIRFKYLGLRNENSNQNGKGNKMLNVTHGAFMLPKVIGKIFLTIVSTCTFSSVCLE